MGSSNKKATEKDILAGIKSNIGSLENLLEEVKDHWGYEDHIYRFYHHSLKAFHMQDTTNKIVKALQEIAPCIELNKDFLSIIEGGTGKDFNLSYNIRWGDVRPIIEAFLHAKYFLEMACKYGRELDKAPELLPSGWAAVLYLYNLR